MTGIIKINHVAVAVSDIDQALSFWQEALGLELVKSESVPSQQAMVAFLPVGESEIELVKPLSAGSGLSKFIEEKGPGIHHICFEVDDIDSALTSLKGKGIRLINETPVTLPGRKMGFIHPKSTGGVLIELYQLLINDKEE